MLLFVFVSSVYCTTSNTCETTFTREEEELEYEFFKDDENLELLMILVGRASLAIHNIIRLVDIQENPVTLASNGCSKISLSL